MMRLASTSAAALLLLALITAWDRRVASIEIAAGSPRHAAIVPAAPAPVAAPVPAGEPAFAGVPSPDLAPASDPAAPAPEIAAAAAAPPPATAAPLVELPEVTVLVPRADFAEAPLPDAGASAASPPSAPARPPARAVGPDRSGDLVRRLLDIHEAMRD